MTTTTKVPLAMDNSWTLVTGYSDNVLLVGPPGRYEVFLSATAPTPSDNGMPVTALDGQFGTSEMGSPDSLYARPFGFIPVGGPLTLSLMKS